MDALIGVATDTVTQNVLVDVKGIVKALVLLVRETAREAVQAIVKPLAAENVLAARTVVIIRVPMVAMETVSYHVYRHVIQIVMAIVYRLVLAHA